MDKTIIIQLIASGTGSLGFCLLFRVKKKNLNTCMVGGILCWGVYLISMHFIADILKASLIAAAFSAFYAETAARIKKAPATVFLIPTLIPLVPGGSLYHMMYYAAYQYWKSAKYYGVETLRYVLGIAAGVSLVLTVNEMFYRYKYERKLRQEKK